MPGKESYEEEVRIARAYVQGEAGYQECLQAIKSSESSFRRWVVLYRTGGAAALLPRKGNIYPVSIKKAAVEEYLSGKASMEKLCQKYGLRDESRLRDWIKVYNAHKDFDSVKFSGGGSYMKQGRETTQEERVQIVRECIASGRNYGEMALKHQVSYQQVRTWTLRFEKMGEAGLQDRVAAVRKTKHPVQNWNRPKLKLSSSNTNSIWRKWSVIC